MAAETPAGHQPRMTLSNVVERLTERRGATSSATVKLSAQGTFMPEVTVTAGVDWDEVRVMVEQASWAFTQLYASSLGAQAVEPKLAGVPRSSKAAK